MYPLLIFQLYKYYRVIYIMLLTQQNYRFATFIERPSDDMINMLIAASKIINSY